MQHPHTDIVLLQPVQNLERPKTDLEKAQCDLLEAEIGLMSIGVEDVGFIEDRRPMIWFRYRDADAPQYWWARWLYVSVTTSHSRWVARVSEYIPGRRELFTIPRSNSIDEGAAMTAAYATELRFVRLSLGVLHAHRHYQRHFPPLR